MARKAKTLKDYIWTILSLITIWAFTMATVYYQGTTNGYAECLKDHYKEMVKHKQINVTINE